VAVIDRPIDPRYGRHVCGSGHEPWKIGGAGTLAAATVLVVNLDAVAFSQQWVQAWNAHDVEAVLRHFHEDVVFTSPVAAKLLPETAGVIRGKAELRRYWTVAVQSIPGLRFAVEGVYQGVDTLVILYRNQDDGLVNEVLKFSDDQVIEGHGTYLIAR
jgi:ketosteroid isomerase-like protein